MARLVVNPAMLDAMRDELQAVIDSYVSRETTVINRATARTAMAHAAAYLLVQSSGPLLESATENDLVSRMAARAVDFQSDMCGHIGTLWAIKDRLEGRVRKP